MERSSSWKSDYGAVHLRHSNSAKPVTMTVAFVLVLTVGSALEMSFYLHKRLHSSYAAWSRYRFSSHRLVCLSMQKLKYY